MDFHRATIEKLLTKGAKLLKRIGEDDWSRLPGSAKLRSAIRAEAKFLQKVLDDPGAHLNPNNAANSSNLDHLGGVVACVEALFASGRGCCAVLRRFRMEEGDTSIDVDVVTDGGATWIKVVARNPKGTFNTFRDSEETGFRTVVSVAQLWLDCAAVNPHCFIPPQVAFHFVKGVVSDVATALEEAGVKVSGRVLPTVPPEIEPSVEKESDDVEESTDFVADSFAELPPVALPPPVTRVNLDVTTMVAYVSGLTNNKPGCDAEGRRVKFKDNVLVQQSNWEETMRVKPVLDELFEGKELICCETAFFDFDKIVRTLGGPRERSRADEFKKRLTVVPDNASSRVSLALSSPEAGGKIRPRSIVVFGTGDELRVPTVTANVGFLRAAEYLDVSLVAITHQSRALSEAKEISVEET